MRIHHRISASVRRHHWAWVPAVGISRRAFINNLDKAVEKAPRPRQYLDNKTRHRGPPDRRCSVLLVSEPGSEPVYGIGAVARMLGVTQASLRAWDERYGVVVPTRSSGGHRVYSRDQLDQLR